MMLVERTKIPAPALPVAEMRAHLRLGVGFADEGTEDALLETFLRAAIAAVEAWTGKVLIARDFTWVVYAWRETRLAQLPVAPVTEIAEVRQIDAASAVNVVDPGLYRLQRDTHHPALEATGPALFQVPTGGAVEIDFTAGFGAAWGDVPPDLAHAAILLAAHYHEYRAELRGGKPAMPYGVSALAEPWRRMRLFGGGRR